MDDLGHLLAALPPNADRAIVMWIDPATSTWTCKWIGVTAETAVETLYTIADEIVAQKIPPPDWLLRLKR